MARFLGIDLGTSAVKAVVVTEEGRLLGVGSRELPMQMPLPGRAEQDTETWWASTVAAVREALAAAGGGAVAGIGIDGQMHGTVLLDRSRRPIGRAITWADQRAAALIMQLEADVGVDTFLNIAGTRPAAGFVATTLAWLARYEPERLDSTAVVVLPKDYVRLRLTGTIATDVSDASATALFDVAARTWSPELCRRLQLPEHILPPLLESADVAGCLSPDVADELGPAAGIPVAAGCGDQPAQAVANGILDAGTGSITIGSGGQVLCPSDRPTPDGAGRVHTFCHAVPQRWYALGATLAAGLSLRWLRDLLDVRDEDPYGTLDRLAATVSPGANGLTFLPYLAGERSPIMDPDASGAFVGLTLSHGRAHLARAVLEGVACSLRATRDAVVGVAGNSHTWLATGNGLASPLWRSIVAAVMGEPLQYVNAAERTAVGAAAIAGIACGAYATYEEASAAMTPALVPTDPDAATAAAYDEVYARYLRRSAALLASPSGRAPQAR